MPHSFTLAEARAMLPEVRAITLEMQAQKRRFDELQQQARGQRTRVRGNGHLGPPGPEAVPSEFERVARALEVSMQRLQAMGIEVKDVDAGLLDWPAERDGRAIYLCWRSGEPDILYWHDREAGFAGRQPL